ncbi:MAG: HAMP domain-containing protein [Nitrospirae bacterium]|nr:HAMP domain-containing protein [Nitrospirota bacterium]
MIKRAFSNLSLNKKLTLMMLFLSFVLVTVMFFLYYQSEKALLNELASHTAELSKAIQVGVEEVTGSGSTDKSRLAQYLKRLNTKGVKEISIISNTDEIVASTNPQKVGEAVSPRKKELIIKAELGETVSKEGKAYNVILPVISGEAHYGYIHLKINTEDVSKLLRHNLLKRIFAAIAVFAIGIGIAVFLSWRYTVPIYNIVDATKKVAAGDFEQTLVPLDREDEIGALTKNFNFMVQRLKENKQLEERLREAEHLSAVGQLSRSIAHEIRNPMSFISLGIDHLKDKYSPENARQAQEFASLISSMKQEIHRLDKLLSEFLDYGRPLKLKIQPWNIEHLLSEVVQIIRPKAEADGIKIIEKYDSQPLIMLDPELIKTCIFNVITNSFQSIEGKGTITIKTERNKDDFLLSISDTGTGLSKENIARVFEPFFTTKSSGLGLGLATTKRIIEEHRGKVDFQSIEGKGTEVVISLPIKA